ncbi:MAG: hypothetical protein AB1635_10315 [Acidobacteriota bacterium]
MIPLRLGTAATLALAWMTVSLTATPGFWQVATLADFLRGDIEHLSVDEHGRLLLGPRVDRVHDADAPFVWTAVQGRDGAFYLGTGNDGKVIKVPPGGAASVVFDSAEMEVHALALAPGGALYAGTSPDGRIYRIDASGAATPFFDPEDKYIWSLAVDRAGVVYAGTGDKGVVYRILPDGTGAPFFSTRTTHAISLAVDPQGQLLVGTGSPGRVFRVDGNGRGFLLLDTAYQEVRALRLDPKGTLYVAAQSAPAGGGSDAATSDAPPPPPAPVPVPSVSTEITSIAIVDAQVSPAAPATAGTSAPGRAPTGAVYRVLPDGLWDQVWESREDAPYDLLVDGDGLIVATGRRGRIFRLSGEPVRATLLTRLTAQQATILIKGSDRTWIGTANPGLLLSMSAGRAERGTWTSDVKDARLVATWGTLAWRSASPSGAAVQLQTRSGNTRTPDDTWSDWSAPYDTATGSAIVSPKARYLQIRVTLTATGDTPVLTSLSAAYLQRNVRPRVESITVHPPGVVFQKPFSSGETEIAGYDAETMERRVAQAASGAPALGRRTFQRGLQTFAWKADDENGDELLYDVLYRREGDTTWKSLKSGITDTILVWDTSSVPNGTYVLKVVATDERSHPATAALRGELESASFEIDNSPPLVTIGEVRRDGGAFVVPVEVRDADSPVSRVEFSLDAQRWQTAFPLDGILDSRQERFEIRVDAGATGRTVVVRALDAMANAGTAEARLR